MPKVPLMTWSCRWSSLCSLQPTELVIATTFVMHAMVGRRSSQLKMPRPDAYRRPGRTVDQPQTCRPEPRRSEGPAKLSSEVGSRRPDRTFDQPPTCRPEPRRSEGPAKLSSEVTYGPVRPFGTVRNLARQGRWSRRQESNLYLPLRRRPFCTLNYGEEAGGFYAALWRLTASGRSRSGRVNRLVPTARAA